jgi:hypothetical protein
MTDRTKEPAGGFGGPAAFRMLQQHLEEFLIGLAPITGLKHSVPVRCNVLLAQFVSAANRENLQIDWWVKRLSPESFDGPQQLKRAHPNVKFATGEHEDSFKFTPQRQQV